MRKVDKPRTAGPESLEDYFQKGALFSPFVNI